MRIVDFQQLDSGLLGITVEGELKVSVVRSWQQEDGLNLGDVECLIAEAESEVPERYHELPSVLRALFRHPVVKDLGMDVDYEDARDVGWRLTELLPLDKQEKQRLAELQDPLERLQRLQELLEALEQKQGDGLLTDKVDRINAALDMQSKRIENLAISATRPAMVLSTGIIARSALPFGSRGIASLLTKSARKLGWRI